MFLKKNYEIKLKEQKIVPTDSSWLAEARNRYPVFLKWKEKWIKEIRRGMDENWIQKDLLLGLKSLRQSNSSLSLHFLSCAPS